MEEEEEDEELQSGQERRGQQRKRTKLLVGRSLLVGVRSGPPDTETTTPTTLKTSTARRTQGESTPTCQAGSTHMRICEGRATAQKGVRSPSTMTASRPEPGTARWAPQHRNCRKIASTLRRCSETRSVGSSPAATTRCKARVGDWEEEREGGRMVGVRIRTRTCLLSQFSAVT